MCYLWVGGCLDWFIVAFAFVGFDLGYFGCFVCCLLCLDFYFVWGFVRMGLGFKLVCCAIALDFAWVLV